MNILAQKTGLVSVERKGGTFTGFLGIDGIY